jgi:hypothetical protein
MRREIRQKPNASGGRVEIRFSLSSKARKWLGFQEDSLSGGLLPELASGASTYLRGFAQAQGDSVARTWWRLRTKHRVCMLNWA